MKAGERQEERACTCAYNPQGLRCQRMRKQANPQAGGSHALDKELLKDKKGEAGLPQQRRPH